uniref:Uncharacterized protein n=1 Tax=Arundo donax TaxID=35708 RepID=A0A0A8XRU1_ARUDO
MVAMAAATGVAAVDLRREPGSSGTSARACRWTRCGPAAAATWRAARGMLHRRPGGALPARGGHRIWSPAARLRAKGGGAWVGPREACSTVSLEMRACAQICGVGGSSAGVF